MPAAPPGATAKHGGREAEPETGAARERDEGEPGDERDGASGSAALVADGVDSAPFGLDPLERALWHPHAAAELRTAPPPAGTTGPSAQPPLEALVDQFVKRFAMSGDRRKGTAHLGVGAGELAGGAVTVHADGGKVTVVVDAPPGVCGAAFGARLGERLRARGIDATIEVR